MTEYPHLIFARDPYSPFHCAGGDECPRWGNATPVLVCVSDRMARCPQCAERLDWPMWRTGSAYAPMYHPKHHTNTGEIKQ